MRVMRLPLFGYRWRNIPREGETGGAVAGGAGFGLFMAMDPWRVKWTCIAAVNAAALCRASPPHPTPVRVHSRDLVYRHVRIRPGVAHPRMDGAAFMSAGVYARLGNACRPKARRTVAGTWAPVKKAVRLTC